LGIFFSLPWTLIRQSNEPCLPCHLLLIGAWWSSLSSSFFVCSFFHGTSLLTITILCLFRMHLNRNIVIVIEYWERRQTGLVFFFYHLWFSFHVFHFRFLAHHSAMVMSGPLLFFFSYLFYYHLISSSECNPSLCIFVYNSVCFGE
jgi:hypothetical protein